MVTKSRSLHGFPWLSITNRPYHPFSTSRSSSLHSLSIQSCCRYVLLGCPTLALLCEGVHWRISLMISFLLLLQCPAYLVYLTWVVLEIGGRWPYNCCFMDVASRIGLIQLVTFLCSSHLAFSLYALSACM